MDKEKRNEMEPRIEIESKVYFERGRLPKVRENLGKLGAFQIFSP